MTTAYLETMKQLLLLKSVLKSILKPTARHSVLRKSATASLMAFFVVGCGGLSKLSTLGGSEYDLPVVTDSSNAATIFVSSQDNVSDAQFLHLLKVDGTTVMKLKEGDRKNFQIDAGTYEIESTCHSVPDPDISSFPVNLSVVDGRKKLELTAEAGDELCLRITKPILNCVDIEEASLDRCQ